MTQKSKKLDRTDPYLPANLEDDIPILMGKAKNLYSRFKNTITSVDDIFQYLCEVYLEGVQSFHKKPRTIPIRIFVFKYIEFILLRTYRGQYRFENRDVSPVETVLDPDTIISDEDVISHKNPYLFEDNYDLNRALSKYTYEERIIIYYRFFLEKPMKEVKCYLPDNKSLSYIKMKKLMTRLRNDPDLIQLYKEK